MASNPFETAESLHSPTVRQISVFLDHRVGVLMRLFKTFEGSTVRVVAMSVVHAVECAVVRLICDDTDTALKLLHDKGFATGQAELLVVEIPHGHGLMSICAALVTSEANINYAYPLLIRPTGRAALAIHTDDLETALVVLKSRKFCVISEDDLGPGPVR